MARLAGVLLVVLLVPAMAINLYFTALLLGRWGRLRARLSGLFATCGADTSSCSIVVRTPYARLFGGAPNVWLGIVWCLALAPLAVHWIVSGTAPVPWPYLVVAAGTVAVGIYLVYALVVLLKQPCPL